MRLPVEIPLPDVTATHFLVTLRERFRQIVSELNRRDIVESASAPTWTGQAGQFVARTPSAIVEAGTTPNKYTIIGWRYVGSAWVEQRMLTGN